MKKSRLLIDLDNVISDSDAVVRTLIMQHLNICADKTDIVTFNYWEALGYDKKCEKAIWNEFHNKLCSSAKPIKHSIDALRRLRLYAHIHILTARDKSAQSLTTNWLKKFGVPYTRLQFASESDKIKAVLASTNGLLVEDRGETAAAIAGAGKKVILFDNPWNKKFKHKNIVRLKSWRSIYLYVSRFNSYAEALQKLHRTLYNKAKVALENSYSPYSKYRVGAALMTTDGTVFTGCNIENVAFSPTICAERTAIFNAISEGYKKGDLFAISVAAENSSGTVDPSGPCGVCRQVMQEFSDPYFPIQVSLMDKRNRVKIRSLNSYLPFSFHKL